MFLSKISVERPVLIIMLFMVFIVFGILAYIELPLNMMPEMKIPYVSISTIYPGAGPREVETQISKKIEDAVATVSQIENIDSYSMDNVSIVVIKFSMGKDVNVANQEVKDKIDAIITQFPTDAQKPVVQKIDINAFPFMDIVLTGNIDGKALYEIADKKLKDRFSQIEGVANVSLTGGNKRQINIKLKDRTVFENSISMSQMAQILAMQNMDMPAGQFNKGTQEYSVRLKGQYQNIDELRNAEVPTSFGAKKLGQIATVEDAQETVRERAIYFNVPKMLKENNVVRMSLINSSDGNVVNIAKEVSRQLPEIQKELPKGVELTIIRDDSAFTKASVDDTVGNILMGILLTGLILLIFLHDLRSTLIVGIAMPISIVATFMFIKAMGFTLNIMTLMAISTSVGVLVTNSVVVLENIFRHKDLGNNRREAAQIGTSEIAIAVLASTLTNVVVFVPIATMKSMIGQVFVEFGITVTIATLISLVVSFTITPLMASRLLPDKIVPTRFGRAFDAMFDRFGSGYKNILSWILFNKKRATGLIIVTLITFIASFGLVPSLGTEMMPMLDQGYINVAVELPQGTNLEQTAKTLDDVSNRIARHKEVKFIVTNLGKQGEIDTGTNLASTDVQLVDAKERTFTTNQMMGVLINALSSVPNARIKVTASESFGASAPIEFFLKGTDTDKMEQIKADIVSKIRNIPGLINLDTSTRSGKSEITIIPNRVKMSEAEASVYDLAMALRTSVEGAVSTTYRELGNEYDIKLSMENSSVDSPEKLRNLPVVIMGNNYVLSQLADVTFADGVNKIIHHDKSKAIQFTGGVATGANLGDVTKNIQKELDKITLPTGYSIAMSGDSQMLGEVMIDLMRTFILAVLLTYMLLAAILESFLQPLLIMATVPLALIGVFGAMFFAGTTINIFSMMAIIMLVGIVVNNAILIMDYVNLRRRDGVSAHDALLEATTIKLKPIIMSTLSIVIAMIPMAMGIGSAGKEFRQSMGIVQIGGLIVSTFLTLVFIPAFYYLTTKSAVKEQAQ
jgi:HAE1 family hydrophobic/amphiphilic exporter-1